MLTLSAGQVSSLWDEVLPVEVRELPGDLAGLDRVLADPELLRPIAELWPVSGRECGRPTIAMETFVRLMVVKQRTGWGYETLLREVSDSLHLRRFCLVAIDQRLPDESTVRKLARRLGSVVVEEMTRVVIAKATRETRFRARAARVGSTVVEADVRYPTDASLALQGVRVLARQARKVAPLLKRGSRRVRDRSRSLGQVVRAISQTLRRRTGEAKEQVLALNERAGKLIARSAGEARALAAEMRASARGRGAGRKLRAAAALDEITARCERVAEQIDRRARGLKIANRLVSLADPDARPIRKGKLGRVWSACQARSASTTATPSTAAVRAPPRSRTPSSGDAATPQSLARTGPTISVKVHPVPSFGAGGFDTPSLQGGPDEQRA
jgi:transposase, IS5 family